MVQLADGVVEQEEVGARSLLGSEKNSKVNSKFYLVFPFLL